MAAPADIFIQDFGSFLRYSFQNAIFLVKLNERHLSFILEDTCCVPDDLLHLEAACFATYFIFWQD